MNLASSAPEAPAARRRLWSSVLVYGVAVSGLVYGLFQSWGYDDPYITYRYARNLMAGLGFVYNPGERVLSTTTPLFTLLLAILGRAWSDLPHLAVALGAASIAAGALSLWTLARTWQAPVLGWAALLLYPTFPQLLTTLGSETPLYLACCLGAMACYARQRYGWAGALAALATLTRADGLLVAALLAADYVLGLVRARRPLDWRKLPWNELAAFGLVVLPWFGFALAYFGSLVPATLAAKQHQGLLAASQLFAPGLLALAADHAARPQYLAEAALALLGLGWVLARARRWAMILAWGALYFAAYTALGVTSYFWYYAPLLAPWVVAVGAGLEAVTAGLRRAWPALERARAAWAGGLIIVILAAAQSSSVLRVRRLIDARLPIYRAAGEWLQAETPPGVTVGALEVGIIGYYAQRPMVDFAGLIQPAVADQLTTGSSYQDAARWALGAYQPDYVVLDPVWFPDLMAQLVLPHCNARQVFSGSDYASPGANTYAGQIVIYRCDW